MSVCLSGYLCLYVCLSACLSVCLSVCLFVCLYLLASLPFSKRVLCASQSYTLCLSELHASRQLLALQPQSECRYVERGTARTLRCTGRWEGPRAGVWFLKVQGSFGGAFAPPPPYTIQDGGSHPWAQNEPLPTSWNTYHIMQSRAITEYIVIYT